MKNIHILPTSQPSRLFNCFGKLDIGEYITTREGLQVTNQHIYISSAEEIKVGDWYYLPRTNSVHKCIEDPTELNLERRLGVAKIILSTDQDLIADGVQAIEDEFLEWFVKNPSCEEVETERFYSMSQSTYSGIEYEIIIPKEEYNLANMKCNCIRFTPNSFTGSCRTCGLSPKEEPKLSNICIKCGVDLSSQQERSYSEEEVFNLLMEFSSRDINSSSRTPHSVANWFEQFKKK
jgi:hypothetical protein